MPRSFTELTIFVSSPANLSAERKVVTGAAQDLNEELASSLIRLRVIGWELDVVPGIGPDAQSVIDSQVEYDIYLGMLGAYFGHPTLTKGSGTEQEFEAAYSHYVDQPSTVRVLFYFRNGLENPYSIDLDQFTKVKEFRARIGEAGCLYGEFADQDELLKLVKSHLRQLITKQWDGTSWRLLTPRQPSPTIEVAHAATPANVSFDTAAFSSVEEEFEGEELEEDEDGLLDLILSMTDSANSMNNGLHVLAGFSKRFGEKMEKGTDLLVRARHSGNTSAIRDIINLQADNMEEYTASFRKEAPGYFALSESLLTTLNKYILLASEAGNTHAEDARSAITEFGKLIDATRDIRPGLQQFRESIGRLPPLTGRINRAKKALARELDNFSSGTTLFLNRSDVLIASASAILDSDQGATD